MICSNQILLNQGTHLKLNQKEQIFVFSSPEERTTAFVTSVKEVIRRHKARPGKGCLFTENFKTGLQELCGAERQLIKKFFPKVNTRHHYFTIYRNKLRAHFKASDDLLAFPSIGVYVLTGRPSKVLLQ